VQKDLILSVIDQHKNKDQQTQLRGYFMQNSDAIIVATRNVNLDGQQNDFQSEIVLHN
jgi:hypothetical protein